jgi:hypothetical protein
MSWQASLHSKILSWTSTDFVHTPPPTPQPRVHLLYITDVRDPQATIQRPVYTTLSYHKPCLVNTVIYITPPLTYLFKIKGCLWQIKRKTFSWLRYLQICVKKYEYQHAFFNSPPIIIQSAMLHTEVYRYQYLDTIYHILICMYLFTHLVRIGICYIKLVN